MKTFRSTGIIVVMILSLITQRAFVSAAEANKEVSPLDDIVRVEAGANIYVGPNGATVFEFNNWINVKNNRYAEGFGASAIVAGNYPGNGIRAIAYRIKSNEGPKPGQLNLIIQTKGGVRWINLNSKKPEGIGDEVYNEIMIDLSAGWQPASDLQGADVGQAWKDAISDVWSVGIAIVPCVDGTQSFSVSDFMLIDNDNIQYEMNLTPLGELLLENFQVSKMSDLGSLAKVDENGNGVTDLNELLSGSPDGIIAEVVSTGVSGTQIKWSSVPGGDLQRKFNVYRTHDLNASFQPVEQGQGLALGDVEVQGNASLWTDTSAVGKGPYFYKIVLAVE